MTKAPARIAPPGSRQLLSRILDEPELVAAVQGLEPRTLGRLIDHIGLEDCGELVALASTAQLKGIFDEDLWRSARPGQDETFDAERFALWLEVMLEGGEEFVARKLAELPEDLVTLALQRHTLVINLDELGVEMSEQGGHDDTFLTLTEKALESCLYQEIAEYRIIARRHDGFDAIVTALLALDTAHHELLERLLERCCYLSSEYIEENGGLYDVLTADEMLETDVAAEREDRRAAEGYVAPSAAASFLRLASTTEPDELEQPGADPITRAYFRSYQPAPGRPGPRPAEPPATAGRLAALLRQAAVLEPARATPLLDGASAPATDSVIKQAMRELEPEVRSRRLQELSYLANVLVAGCSFDGRSLRPLEAAEAAVAACNLGLERVLGGRTGAAAADVLARESADRLFRRGWNRLSREVVLAAGRALERALARHVAGAAGPDQKAELQRVASAVGRAVAAGHPWTARGKLDALEGVIEAAALKTVKALMDQCPSWPGESRVDFIATEEQLRRVRAFLQRL